MKFFFIIYYLNMYNTTDIVFICNLKVKIIVKYNNNDIMNIFTIINKIL